MVMHISEYWLSVSRLSNFLHSLQRFVFNYFWTPVTEASIITGKQVVNFWPPENLLGGLSVANVLGIIIGQSALLLLAEHSQQRTCFVWSRLRIHHAPFRRFCSFLLTRLPDLPVVTLPAAVRTVPLPSLKCKEKTMRWKAICATAYVWTPRCRSLFMGNAKTEESNYKMDAQEWNTSIRQEKQRILIKLGLIKSRKF